MKEEQKLSTWTPNDADMKNIYRHAWLDFHADAQKAKQELDRRYAKMIEKYGSYKKMPGGIKWLLKEDYAAHKIQWEENGEEQQKRFGANEPDPTIEQVKETAQEISAENQAKQKIIDEIREAQAKSKSNNLELSI